MGDDDRVTYEASLGEPVAGEPVRLYVWVRRFRGEEELTGRYEVFEDLARLDDFIARVSASGVDVAGLNSARQRFAESLGKTP
ncbi:MAG TPA: hypothetical protein VGX68_17630 [Thermoanaerobaculia bacterium]|jgi:hypothetical protein|nr:hypothetical protein [Thermoanaerobaculia bacterium]